MAQPVVVALVCSTLVFIHFVSHFCREAANKNYQIKKWETWIFNVLLNQTKFIMALLWITVLFIYFLNFLVKISVVQYNVECRLEGKKSMQVNVHFEMTSPPMCVPPPLGGHEYRVTVHPTSPTPRTPLFWNTC